MTANHTSALLFQLSLMSAAFTQTYTVKNFRTLTDFFRLKFTERVPLTLLP